MRHAIWLEIASSMIFSTKMQCSCGSRMLKGFVSCTCASRHAVFFMKHSGKGCLQANCSFGHPSLRVLNVPLYDCSNHCDFTQLFSNKAALPRDLPNSCLAG
eukprot:3662926-Amphidinium_carterae.1